MTTTTYRQAARRFLLEHPECEIRWDDQCQRWACEVDHVIGRAVRPDLKHDPDNWQATCRPCHRAKHDHPGEAKRRGVTLNSWDRP